LGTSEFQPLPTHHNANHLRREGKCGCPPARVYTDWYRDQFKLTHYRLLAWWKFWRRRRNISTRSGGTRIVIWGMTTSTFTTVHVVVSLIGIATGLVVLFGLLTAKRFDGWTAIFLVTTVLTSVTGFGFPFEHLLPSHKVGIISLVLLAVAILARYGLHLAGAWRWIYAVCATMALYLNVFVLVVQSFEKVPALKAMAPTQSEPPFLVAQVIVLLLFIVLGIFAVKKFHVGQGRMA